ncbi:hypothetical protein LJK87_06390 [Paenibacillus sp. P25]|nr:hypothetical protein LJK87_06390 [Paenibacillus sp. P25]
MLLQSHRGELHLLPALPSRWKQGRVRGLRARGGYEVDIEWEEGKLRKAVVKASSEGDCRIRLDLTHPPKVVDSAGQAISPVGWK